MAVLYKVVRRLLLAGITRKTAGMAQLVKPIGPPRENLVYVCLVTYIPDETILGGIENSM
jgi:hypothetical protein